jgi:ribonucleoside-diphosphate reductase alpha chain
VAASDWTALANLIAKTGTLRNSSTIAVPPTGRSSPVIGASTGIEPLFRLTDPHLPGRVHPAAKSLLHELGRDELMEQAMTSGRLPDDATIPASRQAVLATATQISPAGHLAMAAAVQSCVDEAVAKTVNLPSTAEASDIYDIYRSAWEAGCKGITVYRDGSRAAQAKAL